MAKNIKNDAASLSRFRASMYRVPCLIFYFKGKKTQTAIKIMKIINI